MPAITKTRTLGNLSTGNPYLNPATLPGLGGMVTGASNLIQSELGGMPDPSETRTANAAWGVANGLAPAQGMDFLNQRGSRLYRSEIENRKRNGSQDLLAFLRGTSGTISATPGQLMDYGQRQQQNSFENAMSLFQQQMAQRKDQTEGWEQYSRTGAGLPFGSGYNYMKNKRTGQIWGQQ